MAAAIYSRRMLRHLAIALVLVACSKEKAKEPPSVSSERKTVDTTAPTWEKYTSKEGGYSIDLPSKPEEQEQGGMKIAGAMFGKTATDTRTSMCGVGYADVPDPNADPNVVLEAATARHKEGAEVLEDKAIELDKNPGKSIIVKNTSHQKWMRMYIVDKKRIYVLNCGGPFDRAATDGPIALKALDSFALVK